MEIGLSFRDIIREVMEEHHRLLLEEAEERVPEVLPPRPVIPEAVIERPKIREEFYERGVSRSLRVRDNIILNFRGVGFIQYFIMRSESSSFAVNLTIDSEVKIGNETYEELAEDSGRIPWYGAYFDSQYDRYVFSLEEMPWRSNFILSIAPSEVISVLIKYKGWTERYG